MHLWSIRRLKEQLRTGPLSARQALPYVLIWTVLTLVGEYLPLVIPCVEELLPWTIWDTLGVGGGFVVPITTVVLFYQVTGGARAPDFLGRFVAISLVVTLRVVAVGIPLVLAAMAWWFFAGPGVGPAEASTAEDAFVLRGGLLLEMVIMWRTVKHGRDLRGEPWGPATLAPGSGAA